jgi:hypothetical protein
MLDNLEYELMESFEGPAGDNNLFGTVTGKKGFMAWYNLYTYPNENRKGEHIGLIRLQITAGHFLKHNTFLFLAVGPVKEKGQIGFRFVDPPLKRWKKGRKIATMYIETKEGDIIKCYIIGENVARALSKEKRARIFDLITFILSNDSRIKGNPDKSIDYASLVVEKFTFEVRDSYRKPYHNIGDMWHMEGRIHTTEGVFGKYVLVADWDKQPQAMALFLPQEYLRIDQFIIQIKFFYENEKIIFGICDAPDDLPEEAQNTVKHSVSVEKFQALGDDRLNTILELIKQIMVFDSRISIPDAQNIIFH